MSDTPDLAERVRLLEQQVEAMRRAQDDMTRLLGQTTLTTIVASLVVQRVGQEIATVIEAAGVTPKIRPMLEVLREQAQRLQDVLEEAANAE